MKTILLAVFAAMSAFQGLELKVVQQVVPEYPPLARAARVQQDVKLSLTIRPDGTVQDAKIKEGHPLLNDAALQAALKSKFNATPFGGTFELAIAFTIPKPVTGTITGRVFDPNGRPIAGVSVAARKIVYSGGKRAWNPSVLGASKTDEQGVYSLSLTDAGEHYLVASINADGLAPQTYYPGTIDGATALPVTLTLNATTIADIRLAEANTLKVSGKVLIPTLEGTARSMEIRLYRVDSRFADEAIAGQFPKTENLQREVPFELLGVPPGIYKLAATLGTSSPNWAYMARVDVEVRDRNVDLTIPLQRNTEFYGRVILPEPPIRLEGVFLTLRGNEGGGSIGASYTLAADGSVRLFNISEGKFNVGMSGNLGGAYVKDIRLGARSVYEEGTITIRNSGMEELQVVLAKNGGAIEGAVQTSVREPVGNAHVFLIPDGARRQNPLFYKEAKADATGVFRMGSIPPGDYKLFAFAADPLPGAMENAEFIAQYEQRGVRVTMREGTGATTVTLTAIPKP